MKGLLQQCVELLGSILIDIFGLSILLQVDNSVLVHEFYEIDGGCQWTGDVD